ncbi:hypothetical protein [Streptomyces avermitilis]
MTIWEADQSSVYAAIGKDQEEANKVALDLHRATMEDDDATLIVDDEYSFDITVASDTEGKLYDVVVREQHSIQRAKYSLLFQQLYANLTTNQINQALRSSGLNHQDWLEFLKYMKGEDVEIKRS